MEPGFEGQEKYRNLLSKEITWGKMHFSGERSGKCNQQEAISSIPGQVTGQSVALPCKKKYTGFKIRKIAFVS